MRRLGFVIGCLLLLTGSLIVWLMDIRSLSRYKYTSWLSSGKRTIHFGGDPLTLYIAIGSAPAYRDRRDALRRSWLRWIDPSLHTYSFYTEIPRCSRNSTHAECQDQIRRLYQEQAEHHDLVFLSGAPTGRSHYAQRGYETLQHALQYALPFKFFLKTDDDGFTCLPVITDELETRFRNSTRLFWGKYWFRRGSKEHPLTGRVRSDENFMIFSRRLVEFMAANWDLLVKDEELTLAVNWAFWSHMLRVQVFDDRDRIDSQQHYVTQYMHRNFDPVLEQNGNYSEFCLKHINAHHVPSSLMPHIYRLSNTRSMVRSHRKRRTPMAPLRREGYLFNTSRFETTSFPQCTCSSHPAHHEL